MYGYPTELAALIPQWWKRKYTRLGRVVPLPQPSILRAFLEVAYHASFMTDEGRPSRFSLTYCTERQWERYWQHWKNVSSLTLVRLGRAVAYDEGELRRLAQATDSNRAYILVQNRSKTRSRSVRMEIEGILDVQCERPGALETKPSVLLPPPLPFLSVRVVAPGSLLVLRSGEVLGGLRQGRTFSAPASGLSQSPLSKFFAESIESLRSDVIARTSSDEMNSLWVDPLEQFYECIERLLLQIREARHGGTVVVVPDDVQAHDPRLSERLRIKYPCSDTRLWKYLVEVIASDQKWDQESAKLGSVEQFSRNEMFKFVDAREALGWATEHLADAIRFIANLSRVDGAIVLTDRLRLLGFGAEVIVASPSLSHVTEHDGRDGSGRMVAIDQYGTRHRSAFRLCSNYESAVAFVVSQDGGVRAVKRLGKNMTTWPNLALVGQTHLAR